MWPVANKAFCGCVFHRFTAHHVHPPRQSRNGGHARSQCNPVPKVPKVPYLTNAKVRQRPSAEQVMSQSVHVHPTRNTWHSRNSNPNPNPRTPRVVAARVVTRGNSWEVVRRRSCRATFSHYDDVRYRELRTKLAGRCACRSSQSRNKGWVHVRKSRSHVRHRHGTGTAMP